MPPLVLFEEFSDQIGGKYHDLGSDTIKVALITSAVTPTKADATPCWGDYSANEVSGSSYAPGGAEILNDTYTEADGVGTYSGDDVTWTYDIDGFTNARWGIVYNDTDANKAAIGFIDLGGTVSLQAGNVVLHWANGDVFTVEIGGDPVQDAVLYVSPNGNDSWSGKSWARPKLTLAAAITALPANGVYTSGGTIYMDRGLFEISEITITKPRVKIVGAAAGATVLSLADNISFGIKLDAADRFTMTDVMFYDQYSDACKALWITNRSKFCCLERVWFHYIGNSYGGDSDPTVAPCAIYIDTDTDYTDWCKFHQLEFWNCYRGIVARAATNYILTDSTGKDCIREYIHSDAPTGVGADTTLANCWFAGQAGTTAGYMMYFGSGDGSGTWSATRIVNCKTELHQDQVKDHIYVDCRNVQIDNHHFGGGGQTSDQTVGVYFDTHSRGCVLGMCRRVMTGNGGRAPDILDYGTNNVKWYGNYGTTPAAMDDVWSATASATITADTTAGNAVAFLTAGCTVMVGPHIVHVVSITNDDTVVLNQAITVDSVTVLRLPDDWY
jgi:hypothetical protein